MGGAVAVVAFAVIFVPGDANASVWKPHIAN